MDVSAISGFNPAVSLISALAPASPVNSLPFLGSALSLNSTQASISSLGRLLNDVEGLQSSAQALIAPGAFNARTVGSSQAGVATATATGGTPVGSYTLQVNRLAQAQTLTTAPQLSSQTPIGSGAATTLSFQFASGVTREVSLGSGGNTLSGIAAAINGAGIGVEAKVVSSSAGNQLSLTGQTGTANAFTIAVAGDEAVAGLLSYPPGGGGASLTTQAQDAEGLLNGTAFRASTNTVATAVTGLILDLQGSGVATLSVAPNGDQSKGVGAFVEAFNAVQKDLAQVGRENPALGLGTSFLRFQLSGALDESASFFKGASSRLAEIGITANGDGTLAFDAEKFRSALLANPEGIASLFSNEGKGVADQVAAQTAGPLSPANLLEIAAPALSPFANLGQSLTNSLFSNLDQLGNGLGGLGNSSLADQFLLAQLAGGSQTGLGQESSQFLASTLLDQTFSQQLASLGTQLNLSRLL